MLRFFSALLSLMLLSNPAQAGGFSRADLPAWTEDLPIPADIPAQIAQSPDGVYFPLADTQIRWQGETKITAYRTVTKVIKRAGLEATAAIHFDYEPDFDDLKLLRLNILRDGKTIALRDTVKEDTFRRETQLENGIIDGSLTVFLQVPDLRVGDALDVIWLLASDPAIKGSAPAVRELLEYSVPVAQTRVVVHWPKDQKLNVGSLPDRVIQTSTDETGGTRLEYRRDGAMANIHEENTPFDNYPDAVLRISGDSDWMRFSSLLAGYYEVEYPLPPEMLSKLDALKSLPKDQAAIAALRMVQDDIRYVSLSVGAGGIYARKPTEVITSGFGDCKDKALLFRTMLRYLGVDALVALTDLDQGWGLRRELQQSTVFDHAIVQVKLGGKTYWFDPTASDQGGDFSTAAPPDYGFALPLSPKGQAFLEPMPATAEQVWQVFVHETYSFNLLGLLLTVQTDYDGGAADWHRQNWANKTQQDISDNLFNYYADRYPGLTATRPATMTDDRATNHLIIKEYYFLPRSALYEPALLQDFSFVADDFTNTLPKATAKPRQTPMTTGGPMMDHYLIEISNAPTDFTAPEAVHLHNQAFNYDFTAEASAKGNMTLDWQYRRNGTIVPAKDAAAILSDAAIAQTNRSWTWDLTPDPDQ